MTVDEIFTKFSFKADTGKAKSFAKATEKIKGAVHSADSVWGRFNSKLAKGFNSPWFDQFSEKITDLRRVQLFINGLRRGFDMLGKVVPGMNKFAAGFTQISKGYNKFSTQLVRIRSSIRSFGTVFGKTIKGIGPMVKSELSSLTTLIRTGAKKAFLFLENIDFNKLFTKLKLGFDKMATAVGKGISAMGSAVKKGYSALKKSLLASNNSLFKGMGNMMNTVEARFKNAKGLMKFGQGIKNLTANVPGLGKLTKAFSSLGLGATAAIAGIVVGVIVLVKAIGAVIKAIKKATEDVLAFEKGMDGVERVTLANAEQMKELESAALAAGEASVFGVGDAANAQKFLAMAGLKTNEIIGALPGTLQLAAAGEMDLAKAADIATNIMSSNALAVSELARINDVLAYTASNSNQSVEEMGSAIQNVGPAARLANVSIEQMASWLAVLANNGLKGEEAGTMVRNAIMDLVNPTTKMSEALQQGGVDMSDFIDAAGKITNVESLLQALQDMDEVSKSTFLGALDARTWRALSPVITGAVGDLREFNMALEDSEGTAERMAAIAFEGLDGAIAEYKSKMETANVRFMKDSNLDKFFEDVVRTGTSLLPGLISLIAGLVKPLGMALSTVMKVIRIITTIIGGALKTAGTVIKGFWTMLQNAIAPIQGLFDRISLGFSRIFDAVNDTNRGPLSMMLNIFSKIGTIIGGLFKAIIWAINPLLEVIDILLNVFLIILPNAINNVVDLIGGKLTDKFDGIKDFFATKGRADTSIAATRPSVAATTPFSGGAPTSSISIGDVNSNVTVNGGTTNEETGAIVAEESSRSIRELLLEGL